MVTFQGKVVHGDNYGKALGFPTANIDRRDFVRRKLKIKLGVWAGHVILPFRPERSGAEKSVIAKNRFLAGALNGRRYAAAIVIGPFDKKSLPKLEAHLLNFKGNLYGKKIIISPEKYLRPFKKYHSVENLRQQIKKDLEKIKQPALN